MLYCVFFVVAQEICDFKTSTMLVYMILNDKGIKLFVVYMGPALFLSAF